MAPRAFTLVELLVVLAVIAMLVGLFLPVLGAVRDSARSLQCLSNTRQLGIAVYNFSIDEDGKLPRSTHSPGVGVASDAAWFRSLAPYGVTDELRHCPDDPHRNDPARLLSYATNDYLERPEYRQIASIPRPSRTVYAMESADAVGFVDHLHAELRPWTGPEHVKDEVAVTRHRGASSAIFVDGHAESIPWDHIQDTFTEKRNFMNPRKAR